MELFVLLSIIIVNYKTSKDVIECLDSIVQYEKRYKEYEIIVVDNNSNDDGLTLIAKKFPFVKLIYAPENGGFAYGNNLGIKGSSGDYILLLNPDTYLEDNSIEKLFNRIKDDRAVDIVGPKLLYPDRTNQSRITAKECPALWNLFCYQFLFHLIFRNSKTFNSYIRSYMNYDEEQFLGQIPGTVFLYKKSMIDEIGYMDENYFMYFEETDYCLQAVKRGLKILYYPNSRIIHKYGQSTSSGYSERAIKDFVESFCYYYEKNFNLYASYMAKIIFLSGSIIRLIAHFLLSHKAYLIYFYYVKYIITNFRNNYTV